LFREGVAKLLSRTPGVEIVADGSTAADAVNIAQQLLPDVLLLDLKLPDDGVAAAATIAREYPSIRIVILTASDCDSDVAAMLQLGVHGYLLKGCTGQEIIRAVQRVGAGEFYVTPSLAAPLLSEMRPPAPEPGDNSEELSGREEIILAQVSKGLTNKEIARALNLREKTVKHHMTHIMQKLGVRNRLEAALIGQKRQRLSGSFPPMDATVSMAPERAAYSMKRRTAQ
jgi:DNA-binding NarL/FixJ family response regulator